MPRSEKDLNVKELATVAKEELLLGLPRKSHSRAVIRKPSLWGRQWVIVERRGEGWHALDSRGSSGIPFLSKDDVTVVAVKAAKLVASSSKDDAKKTFGDGSKSFYLDSPTRVTVEQSYGNLHSEDDSESSSNEEEKAGTPSIVAVLRK